MIATSPGKIASAEGLTTEKVPLSSVVDEIHPLGFATHEKAKDCVR